MLSTLFRLLHSCISVCQQARKLLGFFVPRFYIEQVENMNLVYFMATRSISVLFGAGLTSSLLYQIHWKTSLGIDCLNRMK